MVSAILENLSSHAARNQIAEITTCSSQKALGLNVFRLYNATTSAKIFAMKISYENDNDNQNLLDL